MRQLGGTDPIQWRAVEHPRAVDGSVSWVVGERATYIFITDDSLELCFRVHVNSTHCSHAAHSIPYKLASALTHSARSLHVTCIIHIQIAPSIPRASIAGNYIHTSITAWIQWGTWETRHRFPLLVVGRCASASSCIFAE